MPTILTRPIRTRCPFCDKPGRPCAVCGGRGWVTTTESYTPGA